MSDPIILREGFSLSVDDDTQKITVEAKFGIIGESNEGNALAILREHTVSGYFLGTHGHIPRIECMLTEKVNPNTWKGSASFEGDDNGAGGGSEPVLPGPKVSVTFSGNTIHISHALETKGVAEEGKPAGINDGQKANFEKAIGYDMEEVKGIDIPDITHERTETFIMSKDAWDTMEPNLYKYAVHTNINEFRHYGVGEVLFLSASMSPYNYDNVEVSFNYSISPNDLNPNGESIGSVVKPPRYGHEYLDVMWQKVKDATNFVFTPGVKRISVQRVYDEVDFDILGIPDLS